MWNTLPAAVEPADGAEERGNWLDTISWVHPFPAATIWPGPWFPTRLTQLPTLPAAVCIPSADFSPNGHFSPKEPRLASPPQADWPHFLLVYFWLEKQSSQTGLERTASVSSSRRVCLSDSLEYKCCPADVSLDEFSVVSWFFSLFLLRCKNTCNREASVSNCTELRILPACACSGVTTAPRARGSPVKLLWGLGRLRGRALSHRQALPVAGERRCALGNGLSSLPLRNMRTARCSGVLVCPQLGVSPTRFKIRLLSWSCWNETRIDGCC